MPWFERDAERLRRDYEEIETAFPDLGWTDADAGGWDGRLPLWPFERPTPDFLADVVGSIGVKIELRYPQAYPMVAPSIRAIDPEPQLREWTVHGWHVNGDGTLCLLRSVALWDPRTSITDLLLKAAGWRIEYALMQRSAIKAMTENGIVNDTIYDDLITDLARQAEVEKA